MFGYITPDKPELKIREFEVFRGYYCGVCKAIAQKAGHRGRLVLSYDTAFLALLLDSLQDEPLSGKLKKCAVHPLKKRFIADSTPAVDYASDINILLAYYNLKDKWKDERRLLSPLGILALNKGFRRVRTKHRDLVHDVEQALMNLSKLEKERCKHMDDASEPFSGMMQSVFQAGADFCGNAKALGWIGYNLGKWIYLLDAYDDIEDNIKSGSYNPLLIQFEYNKDEDVKSFKDRIRAKTEFTLVYSLSEAEKAYSLLNIKKNHGILDNIVYRGLLEKTRNVLEIGAGCHEKSI